MKLPRYVNGFVDRHGKVRFYFRRAGFKKGTTPPKTCSKQKVTPLLRAVGDGEKETPVLEGSKVTRVLEGFGDDDKVTPVLEGVGDDGGGGSFRSGFRASQNSLPFRGPGRASIFPTERVTSNRRHVLLRQTHLDFVGPWIRCPDQEDAREASNSRGG